MQVIPAIDLRDGACVQLVGGSYADERIRVPDPLAVAQKWASCGFRRIHLVDLDGATGRGSNRETVKQILGACSMNGQCVPSVEAQSAEGNDSPYAPSVKVQCGGGVRDLETIDELLAAGASEVVLGTKAIENRSWLEKAAVRYPNKIIVAADARGRRLVTRGWSETVSRDVADFVEELRSLPLAAILVTAVDREGRMEGPDLKLMEELASRSGLPLQASGGVRSVPDIRKLADIGVGAAIIGMALYTATLEPQTIIEEFPE